MKILVVLGWATGFGGVEKVVRLFTEEMRARGHEVVIALDQTGVQSTEWLQGQTWSSIDLGMESHGRMWKVRRVGVCVDLLMRVRPDIVLVDIPYWLKSMRFAKALLWRRKKPLLASWVHTHIDDSAAKWLQYADCHLAISKVNSERLVRTMSEEKIRIVHNPVVLPEQPVPRARLGAPHFVFIGRLAREKRVDVLLTAVSKLSSDIDWRLSIIGDGPHRTELRRLQSTLDIPSERITWHGWQADPWACIDDASALVLPSPHEGFGLVLVEALARGVPVIISDTQTALQDVVVGRGAGWNFRSNDPLALSRILQGLGSGALRLSDAAYLASLSKPYGVASWIANFEQALQELLHDHRMTQRTNG
ncbi:glycosyltransferase [Alicyclobacillus fastidiosus]|uniref:Glycosyltransferase n=1 Tax=Alicyclobacillus fastidiosus TaxID=392011 RepID=A0ABV5AAE7_9BACL|nr:glycosyltransferase [Alicyclobacillus fastidiosus]WEH07622.1 glycosyltransferase [Alicyclobacillus fastidiosus]